MIVVVEIPRYLEDDFRKDKYVLVLMEAEPRGQEAA